MGAEWAEPIAALRFWVGKDHPRLGALFPHSFRAPRVSNAKFYTKCMYLVIHAPQESAAHPMHADRRSIFLKHS